MREPFQGQHYRQDQASENEVEKVLQAIPGFFFTDFFGYCIFVFHFSTLEPLKP